MTCARLVLLHLIHGFFEPRREHALRIRAEYFLSAAAEPLWKDDVHCKECWKLARTLHRAACETNHPLSAVLPVNMEIRSQIRQKRRYCR